MKIQMIAVLVASLMLQACNTRKGAPEAISGRYSNDRMTFEFNGDRCFGYLDGKRMSESVFHVKGQRLFISPNLKDIPKMTRTAYCVYDIVEDSIISSHVEDIKTGDRFEEHLAKITLKKEPPQQSVPSNPQSPSAQGTDGR